MFQRWQITKRCRSNEGAIRELPLQPGQEIGKPAQFLDKRGSQPDPRGFLGRILAILGPGKLGTLFAW
jgi:hypothetical protein